MRLRSLFGIGVLVAGVVCGTKMIHDHLSATKKDEENIEDLRGFLEPAKIEKETTDETAEK